MKFFWRSLLLIPLCGFYCKGLHYSKFNYFKAVSVLKTDPVEPARDAVKYSISNMYSCIFGKKYYFQLNVVIDNNSPDTIYYDKKNTSINVKGYSFSLIDSYTTIDEKGVKHSFKTFKIPEKTKIAPNNSIGINCRFLSGEKISEEKYRNSFLYDTVLINVNAGQQGLSYEFRFVGDSVYKSQ